MAQKSNAPGTHEPRASVPQEKDDELEMANDDEDFEDDGDVVVTAAQLTVPKNTQDREAHPSL